jgi:hypothetical protein
MPSENKSGTFAPTDMDLLKCARRYYKDMLVGSHESERNVWPELMKVANLLHRIGRIT